MLKVKKFDVCCLQAYVSEFGEKIFSTNGSILYCKICNVKVAAEKKFTVTQHVARDKHLHGLKKKNKKRW